MSARARCDDRAGGGSRSRRLSGARRLRRRRANEARRRCARWRGALGQGRQRQAIKLVSVGEKVDQLEYFHPDRMASRILGMGDVLSLIEKAEAAVEETSARSSSAG